MDSSSDESLNREIQASIPAKTAPVGGDAYNYWQQRLGKSPAGVEDEESDDYIDSDEDEEENSAQIVNPFKDAAVTKVDAVSSDEDYELSQTIGKNKVKSPEKVSMKSGVQAQAVEDEIDFIQDSVEEEFDVEMEGDDMDVMHSGKNTAIEF